MTETDLSLSRVYTALTAVRAPLQRDEYDLHRIVLEALAQAGLPASHEAPIAPRCRIDLLVGSVGIEIKRGKPDRKRLMAQLSRYAASPAITALIVACERYVALPESLAGKPVRLLCLSRLWGIAL